MPQSKQAAKRLRQDVGKRQRNKARGSAMKTQVKKTVATLESGDAKKAAAELVAAMRLIDKAAKAKVIHKNTAARRKSQLARRLAALQKGK
jgi:small subunit ribosomal protein S20